MGRCCDGRNAYKTISKTRYYAGIAVFYLFHLNFKLTMLLRHYFIKRYPHYRTLKAFHSQYFSQMLKEIKERKGMCVGDRCVIHEK